MKETINTNDKHVQIQAQTQTKARQMTVNTNLNKVDVKEFFINFKQRLCAEIKGFEKITILNLN